MVKRRVETGGLSFRDKSKECVRRVKTGTPETYTVGEMSLGQAGLRGKR